MKNLIDKNKPWGIIRFIHKDGKEHEFYSCINKMTGDRLSAFDTLPPFVNESLYWAKSVFRDIKNKSKQVISFEGNIQLNNL